MAGRQTLPPTIYSSIVLYKPLHNIVDLTPKVFYLHPVGLEEPDFPELSQLTLTQRFLNLNLDTFNEFSYENLVHFK